MSPAAACYRDTIAAALTYAADERERPAFREQMALTAATNLALLASARGYHPTQHTAASLLPAYAAACALVGG